MESENLTKIKIIKTTSSSLISDAENDSNPQIILNVNELQNECVDSDTNIVITSPEMGDTISEPRRPTTRKEIKFFGTEIFDEKNLIKKSPKKFLPRACSFGDKYYNNLDTSGSGSTIRDKLKKQNIISSSLPSSLQRKRFNNNRNLVDEKLKNLSEKLLNQSDYDDDGEMVAAPAENIDDDEFDENICEGVNEKRKIFRKRTTSICFVDEISDVMLSTTLQTSATATSSTAQR